MLGLLGEKDRGHKFKLTMGVEVMVLFETS